MHKLSIIIPTWNTANTTLKCIKTIRKYLLDIDYEIIIVDNASTDNTQSLLSKITKIIYIRNSSNLGFSKANNIGFKNSSGKFLFFLNSDMELIDSSFLSMINYLENHPDIGVIGPRFLNSDMSPQGSVTPPQTVFNAFKEYWLKKKYSFSKYSPAGNLPIKVWSISGGAILIKRDDFTIMKGWNEKYYFYFEDLDLCRQIRKMHKYIYFFPICTVIHHHGISGKNVSNTDNQWRRLIPSSKLYHGLFVHYLLYLIIWSSQKFWNIFKNV
jgi:N-acetylglucosaminyl-diphospho-decaprenol L-rhamnosyltransferase